ncbi:sine oculis-binding protein homolog isoform X2 [Planococcus citri]|uniref:sine oculis-binding protein homolog isoform X2 n=1 Tax=Planococcus citri TaxID=170843 RepID=UPI0031F85697
MSAAASGINLKKNKKDNADKEMKEYAETAMNELLASTSFTRTPTTTTTPQRKRSSTSVTAASSAAAVSSDGSLSSSCSEDSIGGINSNSSISPARRDGSLSPSPANVCVPAGCASCGWCHKIGPVKCFTFKMANCNKVFCSEVCFTHYRRANFKRNKTCDWCRHVRHTVNYVDLQDGDSQYQFCSDKCLNQFKLDIFCQETKEHLEMHPHHQEQLQNLEGTSLSTLITPDLWLKNCASPPRSDKSRSSTPPINVSPDDESPNTSLTIELRKEYATLPDEPASKKKCKRYSNEVIKKKKSKKLVNKLRPLQLHKVDETLKSSQTHTEPTPPRIPFYPNFSSMLPPPNAAAATNNTPEYLQRPQYFQPLATPAVTPSRPSVSAPVVGRSSLANSQIPPLLPITRPPQIINQNPQPVSQPPPPPQVLPVAAANAAQNSAPKSILPPPTVLVPYPIVLPIPIPIPIPIPLPIFLNDAKKTTDDKTRDEEEQEAVELEQDKVSPPQSPVNLIPAVHTKSSKKKRKKMCSSEEDSTLKHLVENY